MLKEHEEKINDMKTEMNATVKSFHSSCLSPSIVFVGLLPPSYGWLMRGKK